MTLLQKIGIGLFTIGLIIFTMMNGLGKYEFTESSLEGMQDIHRQELLSIAQQEGVMGTTFNSNIAFIKSYRSLLSKTQKSLNEKATGGIPEGVGEWDFKLGNWKISEYTFSATKNSLTGPVAENPWLFLFLTIGLGIIGGLIYIIPILRKPAGIKNDQIYHSPMQAGLMKGIRRFFLGAIILGVLVFGFYYKSGNLFWPLLTLVIIGIISALVFYFEGDKELNPPRSAGPGILAWLGILTGIYLITFYVFLYWFPEYLAAWIAMVDPLSEMLSGKEASQWFLYGLLYTVIVLVMGLRMIAKYRHNKYQIVRTISVMFFQTCIAFLLPEILLRLNQPYYDFKNIWPLNYTFFFDWNINNLIEGGGLGIFMLVWGIVLTIIGVPVITYFFGKRWYCSWVCGCGGLAETLGDPYRQLSDKSLRAWKYERYIIHGVLVFAVVMTILVLVSYFTGSSQVAFLNSEDVRSWYGFLIGSAFAGVVGTGFYPLMGNRVWCRFGCPLAAYLGLVQRFKSRFRITTNGGQCISCGNCSTYCEMGIDVRWYAQRGQDIVRSSCVGCGICSAVCPRGVLRLENGSNDINDRAEETRVIHISEDKIGIL